MSCVLYTFAACAALLSGAFAQDSPQVVIDSRGNAARSKLDAQLASVMRRESAKLHQPEVSLVEEDELLRNGTITSASSSNSQNVEDAPRTHLERAALNYSYIEEKVPGRCHSQFTSHSGLTLIECAKKCYEEFACERFSHHVAGGPGECRVTTAASPIVAGTDGGQCPTSGVGAAGQSIVYQLVFFHVVDEPGSCSDTTNYVHHPDAPTKAACAHACKNTAGCTKFTAEPDCDGNGCRISKEANSTPSATWAAEQCTVSSTDGCTVYEVFR